MSHVTPQPAARASIVALPRRLIRVASPTVTPPGPSDDWRALLGDAESARRAGRYHEALQLSDRAAQQGEEARYHAALLRGETLLDLGDAGGALSSFDSVADPTVPDPDLDLLRGLALFELARLPEADNALRSAIRGRPDAARGYHTLALIAEIQGSGEEVELFRMARRLRPDAYPAAAQLSRAAFEALVDEAIDLLPEATRRLLDFVPVMLVDVPFAEDLRRTEPPTSPRRLAMMVGGPGPENEPPAVLLFQRNLERACPDRASLVETVRRVVEGQLGRIRGLGPA